MNRILPLYTSLIILITYFLLTSSSGGRASVANQGNTGAPGESTTCVSCHGGSQFGAVSINIEVRDQGTGALISDYTPGTTYDLSITIINTSGSPNAYGFQLTALDQSNSPIAGYSNLGTNVQQATLGNGKTYIEHNGPSTSNVFQVEWTAPVQGTGAVNFYASGNAVNGTGNTGGDGAATNSITLSEEITTTPISITASQLSAVTCNGTETGAGTANASGGTPPYIFEWNPGNIQGSNPNNLAAGIYTVTVTDSQGQSATTTATITEPQAVEVDYGYAPIPCNGDSTLVSLNAVGGNGIFLFAFGQNEAFTSISQALLPAGSYTFFAKDDNQCVDSVGVIISEPEPLEIIVNDITADNGSFNGSIDITVSGGTQPYSFEWSNPDNSNTEDVSSLGSGLYTVFVEDAFNCSVTSTGIDIPFVTKLKDVFESQISIRNDNSQLTIENKSSEVIDVKLLSLSGQILFKQSQVKDLNINITELHAGLYIYVLSESSGKERLIGKFIKQ